MAEMNNKDEIGRLEYFIGLARKGKRIKAEIELRKQPMIQKVHPSETPDMKDEINTYILIADYTFELDEPSHKVSKVYMFAVAEESVDAARINRNIANARLNMDYQRLKAVNIEFQEKFF